MGNSSSLTAANTDPLLIVGITLLIIMVLVINVYTLVYWQHPDDRNDSYFAKFVIIFGLQLSSMCVLMLPIDVANNGGSPSCDESAAASTIYCGGIDMLSVWEVLFLAIAFVFVVFIPFCTFYYEADDGTLLNPGGKKKSRFLSAAAYEICVLFGFLCMLLALYYTEATANVPIAQFQAPFLGIFEQKYTATPGSGYLDFVPSPYLSTQETAFAVGSWTKSSTTLSYQVGFPVYVIALSGWIGWWLFSIFCGVGLVTLPLDMFLGFIYRPRILAPDEMATKEAEVQERTNELLEISVMLKRERMAFGASNASRADKRSRVVTDRLEINRLTQMVFLLERDVRELRSCKTISDGYNPLVPWAKLFCGLVFTLISIMWILQIFMSMVITPSPGQLLNVYLIQFDTWFPMFGNITYAIFSLYLLFATVAGCFKIGLRVICMKIHPMEVGGTYVNSFLFNLGIILLCTIPIVHFCVQAFEGYARNTDSFLLFNIQVKYLTFYGLFFTQNVFTYIILSAFFGAIVWLAYSPRETAPSADEFKNKLARRGAENYAPVDAGAAGGGGK